MRVVLCVLATIFVAMPLCGQELEPRAFSPGPVGLNIAAATASYSTGDLVFDSSLPLEGVTSRITLVGAGYQRFFGLGGKTAKFAVAAAWADSKAQGLVFDQFHERKFNGLTDPRIAFSWIFKGAPAMTPAEYAKYKPNTIAGVSMSLSPPLGEYEVGKLLNAGTNRWTLRNQLGMAHYRGRWTFEGTLGAQLFTDNDEFLGTSTQSQDPIYSLQAHCSYTFRQQLWLAGGATFFRGGDTTTDGVTRKGFQKSSRIGVSASLPVGRGQALGMSYHRGLVTDLGADYDTLAITWSRRWLNAAKP